MLYHYPRRRLIIFYTKDVLSAGQKVLVYLPDGGHCDSAEDCQDRWDQGDQISPNIITPCYRCSDTSPESCTTAENNFMDLSDGIWSSSQDDNPFSDYFKVYVHYCTNDDYSGEFETEEVWCVAVVMIKLYLKVLGAPPA